MSELQKKIDAIENRAAESQLLSELAIDSETRLYNASLAKKLRWQATKLRHQHNEMPGRIK